MSEFPFELYKYHKINMRNCWKKRGMIFVDEEHYDYIYNITKCKNKRYKNGYCFYIHITRDGKHILSTTRKTLEKAIKCRDEFRKAHPEIYT